jgi:hypothetical protein
MYTILPRLPTYPLIHTRLAGHATLGWRHTPTLRGTTPYLALRPCTWHYALPGPTAFYLALRPSTIIWPYSLLPLPPYREHAPTPCYSGGITCTLPCLEDVPAVCPTHGAGMLAYPYIPIPTLGWIHNGYWEDQNNHPLRIQTYLTVPTKLMHTPFGQQNQRTTRTHSTPTSWLAW